ncbi:FAD-dependent oxidoreductase [Rhodoferax bucti]|uniref:FAD-dependent oxidoreductase n=1 Tax=Rhodoferax bucti TaxID=2576305 RepID=UPI0014775BCC|nr:FAD-dependent oxidoreductase [Rhodoferax bucti]
MQAPAELTAWAGQRAWTVLDTRFDAGQRFMAVWQTWRNDPQRPTLLHYVGHITETDYAHAFSTTAPAHAPSADEAMHYAVLHAAAAQRAPGIHRLLLSEGQVSLTLCIGESSSFLSDHRLYANTVWFEAQDRLWDKWSARALARVCARGASLVAQLPPGPHAQWLGEAGFVNVQVNARGTRLRATFDPAWSLGAKEPPVPLDPGRTPHCCVVGAGLSGASVAYALARRGWRVTVLERAARAAAGASGLPVGLVVPHISADDSPRSRLSRVGARLMLQHAASLLTEGEQWGLSGVHEHRMGDGPDRMHTQAGWVKPRALIEAWLAHERITVRHHAEVHQITRDGDTWALTDAAGVTLAAADTVVFAQAYGVRALLNAETLAPHRATTLPLTLGDLQAVHGTATLGNAPEGAAGPAWAMPHNGHGCFIPMPDSGAGMGWLAGSSFEPDAEPTAASLQAHHLAPVGAQHAGNLQRLEQLLPEAAHALAPQFQAGTVQSWSGTRCVTHDRLPLAGPVDAEGRNGLWMHAGMGARGLTFSALGAELIAARLCHEPWPVETSLARSMDAQRLRKRRTLREAESDSN